MYQRVYQPATNAVTVQNIYGPPPDLTVPPQGLLSCSTERCSTEEEDPNARLLQSLSLQIQRQLQEFVENIDEKLASHNANVVSVAVELREKYAELAVDYELLQQRFLEATDPQTHAGYAQKAVAIALAHPRPDSANECNLSFFEGTELRIKDKLDKMGSPGGAFEEPDAEHADSEEPPKTARAGQQDPSSSGELLPTAATESQDHKNTSNPNEDGRETMMMSTDLINLYDQDDNALTHVKRTRIEMFRHFLLGTAFDLVIGVLIFANAVVMAIELEYGGSRAATFLGLPKDTEQWPAAEEAFVALSHIFCLIFLIEFALRIWTLHWKFFKSGANCMDAVIVWISVVDLYIMTPLGVELPNVAFLRLLRIVKLIKALNIIKQLRPFRHLRVLIMACASSLGALFWSIFLLAFVHFMFAIFTTQMLQDFLKDENEDTDVQLEVYKYFGTVSRALLTMWEITMTPGAWGITGRLLIYKVGRGWTIFFVMYVYLIAFGCMKVISALFLKETLAAAANDQDMIIEETVNRNNKFLEMSRNLFRKIDLDGGGDISIEELAVFVKNPAGARWFTVMDIDPPELLHLFELLDKEGTGAIDLDTFCTGVKRLHGGAKALDLIEIKTCIDDMSEELKSHSQLLSTLPQRGGRNHATPQRSKGTSKAPQRHSLDEPLRRHLKEPRTDERLN